MNMHAPKATTLLVNILGVALVLAALALGAGLGNLISPNAPAQATTPTEAPATCTALCLDGTSTGGDAPASGFGGSIKGGNHR